MRRFELLSSFAAVKHLAGQGTKSIHVWVQYIIPKYYRGAHKAQFLAEQLCKLVVRGR